MVALAWQSARSAHHRKAVKLAEGKRHAAIVRLRLMIQVVMHVSGNEQVKPSIAVIVAPSRAVRPVAERHTSFLGHVSKRAVVIVAIEPVLPEVGDKDVGPAVIIE